MMSTTHPMNGLAPKMSQHHRQWATVPVWPWLLLIVAMITGCSSTALQLADRPLPTDTAYILAMVDDWPADSPYPDEVYAIVVLKEAIAAFNERNGPIGACLVREKDSQIVEQGRNRQFEPYFRSHAHAEMDLLDRYEEHMQVPGPLSGPGGDPHRIYEGLILYSSLEPCPMCMTRILNAGIRKIYYLAEDDTGGMATRIDALPPFWRQLAQGRIIGPAECSPELSRLAGHLFTSRIHLRRKVMDR